MREVILYTLLKLAEEMGGGRGFRFEEAARQVFEAFDAGDAQVTLYLTHPERTYTVEAGDILTSLSAKFGMPPGLVAEANAGIDVNRLSIGQPIIIPSQDILTPYMPVRGKRIVVSITESVKQFFGARSPKMTHALFLNRPLDSFCGIGIGLWHSLVWQNTRELFNHH